LVDSVGGLRGKIWYVLDLDRQIPPGFNPLRHSALRGVNRPFEQVLLAPVAEGIADSEVPPDYIGQQLARDEPVLVTVVVSLNAQLPREINLADVQSGRYPNLAAGEIELL
jgi:hypothetical protein